MSRWRGKQSDSGHIDTDGPHTRLLRDRRKRGPIHTSAPEVTTLWRFTNMLIIIIIIIIIKSTSKSHTIQAIRTNRI